MVSLHDPDGLTCRLDLFSDDQWADAVALFQEWAGRSSES